MSYEAPWAEYAGPYFCAYFHPVVADAIRQYDFAWPGGYEGPAHIISQDGGTSDYVLGLAMAEVDGHDDLRAAGVRWLVERIRTVPEGERVADKGAWGG